MPNTVDVVIKGHAYVPASVSISQGDTVRWTNQDAVTHTVTSDDGLFDSGDLDQGDTFTQVFQNAGTFKYHCTIHASMKGTVLVT